MTDKRITVSTPFHRDDRGVSEVLAFVLVFGIILSSVTILSMTGFQAMEGYQENEQQRNADRAMIALSDNFNDVLRYDGIKERYGELTVRGGTISATDGGTKLDISVDGTSVGDRPAFDGLSETDGTFELGEFTYESGSETIVYEGGAVTRESESGGEIDLADPHIRHKSDNNVAVISIVKIDGDGRSIQTDGSQGVTIEVTERASKVYPGPADVTIDATDGDRESLWDNRILDEWPKNDVDHVVVTVVEVEIDY